MSWKKNKSKNRKQTKIQEIKMEVFECFRKEDSIIVMTNNHLNIVKVLTDIFDDADKLDLVSFETLLQILDELREVNIKKHHVDDIIVFKIYRDDEGFYTTSFLTKN